MNNTPPQMPSDVSQALDRIMATSYADGDLGKVIKYFYNATDLSPLSALLESSDENVLGDGIYILSEIGRAGTPLRDKAKLLLDHADIQIRYWAMNSVVSCFSAQDAKDIIENSRLLEDSDDFVRSRAREMFTALDR